MRWGIAALGIALLSLTGASSAFAGEDAGLVTAANGNLRTGWYPDEPTIEPSKVTEKNAKEEFTGFTEAFKAELKGQIYAQPLIANGTLLVVTEEDWAYGLDPVTGTVLWEKQFGAPVTAGETGSDATVQCPPPPDLYPYIGITSTPVIDTEKNIAYFVSNSYVTGDSGEIGWYMNAISLSSGEEVHGFPVKIEGGAENLPGLTFEPVQSLQRPALLLLEGVVYAGFGSHCDVEPFKGWLVGVSTAGKVVTKWATSKKGASIWQSGGGLISDGPRRIIFATGPDPESSHEHPESFPLPGPGDEPMEGRLDDSVVQVEVQSNHSIKAEDFFSPFNNVELDEKDMDLGSAAPIALPPEFGEGTNHPELLVQASKQGKVYLLDRDDLGGTVEEPGPDDVVQTVGQFGGVWDAAAAWPGEGGYVYIPAVAVGNTDDAGGNYLRFFEYKTKDGEPELSLLAETKGARKFGFGSGSPIVTSNGTKSGSALLWTTWCPGEEKVGERGCEGAELRAYEVRPKTKEDVLPVWYKAIGTAAKFSRPDASKGFVYVGNNEGDVFGFSRPGAPEGQNTERAAEEERVQHASEEAAREAKEELEAKEAERAKAEEERAEREKAQREKAEQERAEREQAQHEKAEKKNAKQTNEPNAKQEKKLNLQSSRRPASSPRRCSRRPWRANLHRASRSSSCAPRRPSSAPAGASSSPPTTSPRPARSSW